MSLICETRDRRIHKRGRERERTAGPLRVLLCEVLDVNCGMRGGIFMVIEWRVSE